MTNSLINGQNGLSLDHDKHMSDVISADEGSPLGRRARCRAGNGYSHLGRCHSTATVLDKIAAVARRSIDCQHCATANSRPSFVPRRDGAPPLYYFLLHFGWGSLGLPTWRSARSPVSSVWPLCHWPGWLAAGSEAVMWVGRLPNPAGYLPLRS